MNLKQLLRPAGLVGMLVLSVGISAPCMHGQNTAQIAPPQPGILTREQAAAILPPSVFFHGQSASIQARNSSGVRLADGKLILAALVDTSGYSSGVKETYQAYLITEVPLNFGDQVLTPGAYGFGFVAADRMTIMDLGGSEVLHAPTSRNEKLTRPTPLQILADGDNWRLYLGRIYVSFTAVPGSMRLP